MNDCLFCKIKTGEIPSSKVYEDEDVFVFNDIHPKAPVHVLVVPKKHIDSLKSVTDTDTRLLGKLMMTIQKVGKKLGIDRNGYKVIANNGEDAGQLVFHLHFHLLGGWRKNPFHSN